MSSSGNSEFNIDQLTAYNNNSYCENNLNLDGFSYLNPSDIAGPSQPYFGTDVWGDINNYPNFPTPSSAPMSLLPFNGGYLNEGKPYFTPQCLSFEDSHSDRRVQLLPPGLIRTLHPAIATTGDHPLPRPPTSGLLRTDPCAWL